MTTIEQVGKMMRSGDVEGIEKIFGYAADWNTREIAVNALQVMVLNKVDFDINAMKDALSGIVEVCEAEVGGGTYKTNCLKMANGLLNDLRSR